LNPPFFDRKNTCGIVLQHVDFLHDVTNYTTILNLSRGRDGSASVLLSEDGRNAGRCIRYDLPTFGEERMVIPKGNLRPWLRGTSI